MENLDINSLRSFILFNKLGSLALTADKVGRTQAAVSLQLKRLEDQLGCPLFTKSGRRMVLSGAGKNLLHYAQKIIQLNDVALNNVRTQLKGEVTLGLTQDLADEWLLPVLNQFKVKHPNVRINVCVDRNYLLEKHFKEKKLGLVLLARKINRPSKDRITVPMLWVGSKFDKTNNGPINLILFDGPCLFREQAIKNLKEAGIPFEITFTSASLSAVWSAVRAGLGITLRSSFGIPKDLMTTDKLMSKTKKLGQVEFYLERRSGDSSEVLNSLYTEVQRELKNRRP